MEYYATVVSVYSSENWIYFIASQLPPFLQAYPSEIYDCTKIEPIPSEPGP